MEKSGAPTKTEKSATVGAKGVRVFPGDRSITERVVDAAKPTVKK